MAHFLSALFEVLFLFGLGGGGFFLFEDGGCGGDAVAFIEP
jgi:hypothetical protein